MGSPIIDPSLSGLYSFLIGGWSDKLYISFLGRQVPFPQILTGTTAPSSSLNGASLRPHHPPDLDNCEGNICLARLQLRVEPTLMQPVLLFHQLAYHVGICKVFAIGLYY